MCLYDRSTQKCDIFYYIKLMLCVSSLISNMDFVALLSVFAITVSQVVARSIDIEGTKTKDGSDEKLNIKEFKFTLPTFLQHSFKMIINGTLDRSHENFLVKFPPEGDKEARVCTLNFNYKKNNFIEVTPYVGGLNSEDNYRINHTNKESDFRLSIEAIDYKENSQMLNLRFEEVNSDRGPLITCEVDSFDTLNHILFEEGVKKIDSILFIFSDMESET